MTIFVYPGTFSPPHRGHLEIVRRCAREFGQLYVVCSSNPEKEGQVLFTPEECKRFWMTYDLPEGVQVFTLDQLKDAGIDFKDIIMVRGVRSVSDFEYEKEVTFKNFKELGIDKILLLVSGEEFQGFSSTRARQLAAEGDRSELEQMVSVPIAIALLKKLKK